MSNTYSKIYIHLIFSTKEQEPLLQPDIEEELKNFIGDIAKENGINLLIMNGTRNHQHLLLVIPPAMPISKVVQQIKGGSSKWLNQNFFEDSTFRWQRGYSAFSVNESMVPATIKYINNQKEHHTDLTYEHELDAILDKHGLN